MKLLLICLLRLNFKVAPRAGAWIETGHQGHALAQAGGRPPRGGVD